MLTERRTSSRWRWLAVLGGGSAACLAAPNAHALGVYHIGNSLVLQNEQRGVIQALAIQAGHVHTYSMSVILGAPLAYIWSNPGASGGWEGQVYPSGLAPSRAWDALVLEPYDRDFTFYPYDKPSAPGYAENDVLASDSFYKLALAGNPRAQLYIYEIFPTANGYTNIPEQRTLAHALTVAEQVNKLHPGGPPVMVIPAGDVIQKLAALADQGQLPHIAGHTALYGDEDHLNEVGSYAVALTHLACLYREDPHVYANRPVYPPGSDWPTGTAIWRSASDYKLLGPVGGEVWPETAAVIKDVVAQVTANTPRSGLDGGVRIVTSSLPPAVVGNLYSATLTGALGQPPYKWSISSGALPAGLRLEADTILGLPTAPTTAAFSVRLSDSATPARSVTQSYTLAVTAADAPFTIATSELPGATRGTRFVHTLAAPSGVAPITWTVESGRLPFGVNLGADGLLQGSPGEEGAFAFSVLARDSSPVAPRIARRSFTLQVAPIGPATVVAAFGACLPPFFVDPSSVTNSAARKVASTDNQVRFGAWWDAPNLHVIVHVQDANIVVANSVATAGDAVELYVNADNGKGTLYGARDRRIVVGPNGDKWLPDGRDTGIVTTSVRRADGYSVELVIPWANMGVTAQSNTTLGFDVGNRDDDGAGRTGALYWFGGTEDADRPSAWGNLLLAAPAARDAGACAMLASPGDGSATTEGGVMTAAEAGPIPPVAPDGGVGSSGALLDSVDAASPDRTTTALAESAEAGEVVQRPVSTACSFSTFQQRPTGPSIAAGLLVGAACLLGRRRRQSCHLTDQRLR